MRDTFGFSGSVVDYPERGSDGNAAYRGNTTGFIIEDFLRSYHRKPDGIFFDPMLGGGTSRDVATRLSSETAFAGLATGFRGFDLRDGFDSSRDDLLNALGRPAHTAFVHPPYAAMIPYSGPHGMWGTAPHEADLSQLSDVEEFLFRLQAVLQNVYQALEPGGHYALLLGNWRSHGKYHHLPAMIMPLCPGELRDEIIKVQNNCTSDRRTYRGEFVPIRHETMLVFRREADGTSFYLALETLQRLQRYEDMTWRNLVYSTFRRGEVKHVQDVYAVLRHHPKAQSNRNYEAKIRQQLQADKRLFNIAKGSGYYQAIA